MKDVKKNHNRMYMIPEHYVKKALWMEYLQERELGNSDGLWGVVLGSVTWGGRCTFHCILISLWYCLLFLKKSHVCVTFWKKKIYVKK